MNLSLRAKLMLWFGLVMAISLAVFGALTYRSISNQLTTGLDIALNKSVQGLDLIIREAAGEGTEGEKGTRKKEPAHGTDTGKPEIEFLRQIDSARADSSIVPSIRSLPNDKSRKNPSPETKAGDDVWTSITQYVVLNPRNFMVQVMDSTGAIVYRSASLGHDSLDLPDWFVESADTSLANIETFTRMMKNHEGKMSEQPIRTAIAKSRSALIVVAYPYDDVQVALQEFLTTLLWLTLAVLVLSTLGGWFLARQSLRPVDVITRTVRDITASNLSRRLPISKTDDEIGRLSETLNDMISRLESSFGRIRQFTADASHELRTPLTILTGELELALRSSKSPSAYQDVISSALQETLRMSRVVEDLLLLSRADLGNVTLKTEPVNLNEMLADLADATAILGAKKDLYISYRHTSDTVMADADAARLHQMFLNLLDNAVKYTPKGGAITLTLHRDGDEAEVRVRDTGIGISKSDQKKIFNRFYRVDKARSRAQGGVGLGLSIVDWTVNAHGGRIRVESEPGQGSTFIVHLPIAAIQLQQEHVEREREKALKARERERTREREKARHEERHGVAGALDHISHLPSHLPKFLKRRHDEEGNGANDAKKEGAKDKESMREKE